MPWEGIFYGTFGQEKTKMGIASNDVYTDTRTITELKQHITDSTNFTNVILLNAQQEHHDRYTTIESKVEVAIGVVGTLVLIFFVYVIYKCCKKYTCNMSRRRQAIRTN